MTTSTDEDDWARDVIAMVQAAMNRDWKSMRVILENADAQGCALAATGMLAGLLSANCEASGADPDYVLSLLRRSHGGA